MGQIFVNDKYKKTRDEDLWMLSIKNTGPGYVNDKNKKYGTNIFEW